MSTRFTNYDPVFDAQQDFRKIMDDTGKILKMSCVRCHLVKFNIYLLGLT